MEDKFKLINEISIMKNMTDNNVFEMNKIVSFFKLFGSMFEEQINSVNNKLNKFAF